MQDKLSIPTDNIYKFYALFGLVLFIFSASGVLYVNKITNELLFSTIVEKETIEVIEHKNAVDEAKLKMIEKRQEIAISDKKFFFSCFNVLVVIATSLSIYGFWIWQRVLQPIQDETAKLQLEKLRIEVDNMKKKKHEPFKNRTP